MWMNRDIYFQVFFARNHLYWYTVRNLSTLPEVCAHRNIFPFKCSRMCERMCPLCHSTRQWWSSSKGRGFHGKLTLHIRTYVTVQYMFLICQLCACLVCVSWSGEVRGCLRRRAPDRRKTQQHVASESKAGGSKGKVWNSNPAKLFSGGCSLFTCNWTHWFLTLAQFQTPL